MNRLRQLRGLAGLLIPGLDAHEARTLGWYHVYGEMFRLLCEDSGFLDFGWSEDPHTTDLLGAQREMVRQVTASLGEGPWLDVGCGEGGPACLVAEEKGLQVTGLNINASQVAMCTERAARLGASATFVEGNAQEMPLQSATFSGVYTIESPLHYPDKPAFLAEVARVLEPGGRFALCDIVRVPRDIPLHQAMGVELGRWLYACPPLWSAADWAEGMRSAGLQGVEIVDCTRQTLGLTPAWIQQLDSVKDDIRESYPPGVYMGARRILVELASRLEDLPIGYALVTAEKPS